MRQHVFSPCLSRYSIYSLGETVTEGLSYRVAHSIYQASVNRVEIAQLTDKLQARDGATGRR